MAARGEGGVHTAQRRAASSSRQSLTFAAEVDAEDVGQLVDENQRHLDGADYRLDVVRRHHRCDVTAGNTATHIILLVHVLVNLHVHVG